MECGKTKKKRDNADVEEQSTRSKKQDSDKDKVQNPNPSLIPLVRVERWVGMGEWELTLTSGSCTHDYSVGHIECVSYTR